MNQGRSPRRFESLEGRMLLSVNVNIVDDTIFVQSGFENDDVSIYQNQWNYLVVKDHGNLVQEIDLDQFDEGWNLDVNLDGGEDHVYISRIKYGLKNLNVDTGQQPAYSGSTEEIDPGPNGSDNDWVKIHYVKADYINVYTGVNGRLNQVGGPDETPPTNGIGAHTDNDSVKLYHVHSYNGITVTTSGYFIGDHVAKKTVEEIDLDPNGSAYQDNDWVGIHYAYVKHGDLNVNTGMVHGGGIVPCVASATEVDDHEHGTGMQDNDHVKIKYAKVYNGNLNVRTGLIVNFNHVWLDSTDEVFADIEENGHDFNGYFEDRDAVKLQYVDVKHDHNNDHGSNSRASTESEPGRYGNIHVETGASIVNDDPYTYLAVQTYNDDDRVSFYCVCVCESLHVYTGAGSQGMIGAGDHGEGYRDRDRVYFKHVHQKNYDASAHVYLGDDDDHLCIHKSCFEGYAKFDGGEGYNVKRVAYVKYGGPYEYINFEDHSRWNDKDGENWRKDRRDPWCHDDHKDWGHDDHQDWGHDHHDDWSRGDYRDWRNDHHDHWGEPHHDDCGEKDPQPRTRTRQR